MGSAILGLGRVLFGKQSPAGRLIQTVYPAAFQNEVPAAPVTLSYRLEWEMW